MKTNFFILLAAVCVAFPAFAEGDRTEGGYIGGSIGQIQIKDYCSAVSEPCEDSVLGWRIFGGYAFNEYFAAEVGGTYADDFDRATLSVRYRALDVGIRGRYPVNDLVALSARGGLAFQEFDIDAADFSDSPKDADILYGVGVEVKSLDGVSGRLEWYRTGGALDFIAVSAAYNF